MHVRNRHLITGDSILTAIQEMQTKHVGTEMKQMSHLAERISKKNFMKEVVLNWTWKYR